MGPGKRSPPGARGGLRPPPGEAGRPGRDRRDPGGRLAKILPPAPSRNKVRAMGYQLHRFVRIAEIVVVAVLSIFALMTWLELNALRKAPVVLPNYQFESLNTSEGTPMVVT